MTAISATLAIVFMASPHAPQHLMAEAAPESERNRTSAHLVDGDDLRGARHFRFGTQRRNL